MKKISETIVFFGSGPVAAKSLELLARDFTIEAVITKPRATHHRGDVPVITLAEKLGLKLLTASNKKELDELFATNPVSSRVAILIDFGIIVSQSVIDYFPLGIINSHFSLLPEWRGADPITFAILSGQKETGVSLMLLVEAMDEGPLLAQDIMQLPNWITTPELTDGLVARSYALLVDVVPKYIAGEIKPYPQYDDIKEPTYSRKLTKDDGVIDWAKTAVQIEREVRAFLDWPKSRTAIAGKEVIVTAAHAADRKLKPGQVVIDGKQLLVGTCEKALAIDKLKPAGKNEMTSEAFIAGHKDLLDKS